MTDLCPFLEAQEWGVHFLASSCSRAHPRSLAPDPPPPAVAGLVFLTGKLPNTSMSSSTAKNPYYRTGPPTAFRLILPTQVSRLEVGIPSPALLPLCPVSYLVTGTGHRHLWGSFLLQATALAWRSAPCSPTPASCVPECSFSEGMRGTHPDPCVRVQTRTLSSAQTSCPARSHLIGYQSHGWALPSLCFSSLATPRQEFRYTLSFSAFPVSPPPHCQGLVVRLL